MIKRPLSKLIGMVQAQKFRVTIEKASAQRNPFLRFSVERRDSPSIQWPRVIAVSSGKGGVGKTNIVANLAFAFTRLRKKVLVLDADLGLANIDVLLGLKPRYTIEHLLNGEKTVFEILIKGPGGMSILPASSGVLELVNLSESQKIFLLDELDRMAERVDILLIDTAAGISSDVLFFDLAAEDLIVIATPEATSITSAYALIKLLATQSRKKRFTILINSAQSGQEAEIAFRTIIEATDQFFGGLSFDYLGFIPFDEQLPLAVRHQRPVLEIYPRAPSSRSFMEVAKVLMERPRPIEPDGNVRFFWKQLFQSLQPAGQNGGGD